MADALAELIERVEQGVGPDRELDWDLACALGETPEHSVREIGFDYEWFRRPDNFSLWKATDSEGRSMALWSPAKRTASLDAVLALIEAKLPGMSWEVRRSGFGTPSQAMIWDPMKAPPVSTLSRVDATSPARALLAATLRALPAPVLGQRSDEDG